MEKLACVKIRSNSVDVLKSDTGRKKCDITVKVDEKLFFGGGEISLRNSRIK